MLRHPRDEGVARAQRHTMTRSYAGRVANCAASRLHVTVRPARGRRVPNCVCSARCLTAASYLRSTDARAPIACGRPFAIRVPAIIYRHPLEAMVCTPAVPSRRVVSIQPAPPRGGLGRGSSHKTILTTLACRPDTSRLRRNCRPVRHFGGVGRAGTGPRVRGNCTTT